MRNRYVLVADVVAVISAAFGAFVLRFDWGFLEYRAEFSAFLAAALVIKPVVFYCFGLYGRYWRYASVSDLLAVVFACGAAAVTTSLVVSLALPLGVIAEFSRAVLVIDSLLTLLVTAGIRMSLRAIQEPKARARRESGPFRQPGTARRRRVLVVGAGDAGAMVVREMQRNPQLGMEPVGFLDDDDVKGGKQIHDVPVLGKLQSLRPVVKSRSVDEVVIAMPTAHGAIVRDVVETCQRLRLKSQTMPGVFELLDGKVSVSRLRHVEVEDLLRRPQVVDATDSSSYVSGQNVLVTGAGGSIGFELCRQLAHHRPARLVMLGHGENSLFEAHTKLRRSFPGVALQIVVADVRDRARLEHVFAQFEPSVVFHTAAHKHVPMMEENFEDAISNNVIGTCNVVEVALSSRTDRFVAISTDKAVAPSSIMGASKWMASAIVQDAARRSGRSFVVVRFGNVLGSRGSVVPSIKAQIESGGPITVTHPEMTRFFMTISEAVHLVLQAGGMGSGGELFVLNMGQPVRIMDLAKDVIRLSGFTTDEMPIVITGVRAGEKLEESLWEDDATVEPTAHPDILRITERQMPEGTVQTAVARLGRAAEKGDRLQAEALLCDWIPSFTPSVSSVAPRVDDLPNWSRTGRASGR